MRPIRLFTTVFLLAFGLMFFLIVFLNSYEETLPKGLIQASEGGVIYNIESQEALEYFRVTGFQFHQKVPPAIRKKARSLGKASRVWALQTKGAAGSISISNLQRLGRPEHPVIVSITYYINWGSGLSVTGIGTNPETWELEKAVEMLSAAEGEGSKPGFCRKLVYLGPVNEVQIDGFVSVDSEFALIDGIQISVGKTKFDNEEEDMLCT